jgi:hypothetical protein
MEMVKPTAPPADDFENPSYPGTGGGVSLQTVQLNTLQIGAQKLLSSMRTSQGSYLFIENGVTYAKLKNVTGFPAYQFTNSIRLLYPTVVDPLDHNKLRSQIAKDLPRLKVGTSFQTDILTSCDFIKAIDTKSFSQFETYFEGKLSNISTPKFGVSKLTENETFALTQLYYNILNYVKWVYTNPTGPTAGKNCLPSTTQEWKDVAKAAFYGAVGNGVRLGIAGVQAGATAALVAGNPIAGGIIGGILGFSIGAVGGALLGAGSVIMWECVSAKIFTPMNAFICGGKQYFAYSVSPPVGCTAGSLAPLTLSNSIPLAGSVELRTLYDYGLVPNKGKTALAASVVSDFNWLLGYIK